MTKDLTPPGDEYRSSSLSVGVEIYGNESFTNYIHMKINRYLHWSLRLIPAIIMLQTLFYKFTAAPESIYIFSKLGAEPSGRIGTGVLELVAGVLLLIPGTTWMGAVLGFGLMAGAIASHLFVLGINVQNDGGQLFIMACVTAVCCLALLLTERQKLFSLFRKKYVTENA